MGEAGVLVVEDEAITAMEIQKILESSGYEVLSIAHTGEDAIKQAIKSQPDLILMDIILNGKMDGVEAAQKIREFMDVPVLYITALESMDFERLKKTKGAGYLVKPISEGELKNNIQIAINNYRSAKEEAINTKYDSLNDVQAFMQSTIPQLSSSLSIEDRGIFLGKLHRNFEKLVKPKFLKETGRYDKAVFESLDLSERLEIYFSWISKFFSNLGFEVDIRSEDKNWSITLQGCSWCDKNNENVFYCLVCQAILKQTFSWINVDGSIKNLSNIRLNKAKCEYQLSLSPESD